MGHTDLRKLCQTKEEAYKWGPGLYKLTKKIRVAETNYSEKPKKVVSRPMTLSQFGETDDDR